MVDANEGLSLTGVDVNFGVPGAVVVNAIPDFNSESEESLALRYGRPAKKLEELTFEFTRDPALLHQYRNLYESECRVVFEIPQFRDAEEEYNHKSYILIARQGKLCVGGGRLTVSTPRKPQSLPLEINNFRLRDHFPSLEQKQMRYGELSRLVLLPEFRTGSITRQLFRGMYRKSLALDLDMVFAAAPLVNVRTYRQHCLAIGLKEAKVHLDVQVPPYPTFEEVKDYLFSVVVDKSAGAKRTILPEAQQIKHTEEV